MLITTTKTETREIDVQFPAFYVRNEYSCKEITMFVNETSAVRIVLYGSISGAHISKHDSFGQSEWNEAISKGKPSDESEFNEMYEIALQRIQSAIPATL